SLGVHRAHLLRATLVDEDEPIGGMEVVVVRDDGLLLLDETDRRAGQHWRGDEHGDPESCERTDVASGHASGPSAGYDPLPRCRYPCGERASARWLTSPAGNGAADC